MQWVQGVVIALEELWAHKLRTFLTLIFIVIQCFTPVCYTLLPIVRKRPFLNIRRLAAFCSRPSHAAEQCYFPA